MGKIRKKEFNRSAAGKVCKKRYVQSEKGQIKTKSDAAAYRYKIKMQQRNEYIAKQQQKRDAHQPKLDKATLTRMIDLIEDLLIQYRLVQPVDCSPLTM